MRLTFIVDDHIGPSNGVFNNDWRNSYNTHMQRSVSDRRKEKKVYSERKTQWTWIKMPKRFAHTSWKSPFSWSSRENGCFFDSVSGSPPMLPRSSCRWAWVDRVSDLNSAAKGTGDQNVSAHNIGENAASHICQCSYVSWPMGCATIARQAVKSKK